MDYRLNGFLLTGSSDPSNPPSLRRIWLDAMTSSLIPRASAEFGWMPWPPVPKKRKSRGPKPLELVFKVLKLSQIYNIFVYHNTF